MGCPSVVSMRGGAAIGIVLAVVACGGTTSRPDCEGFTDSASCTAVPECAWLYNKETPLSDSTINPAAARLHPACFDSDRIGERAVCKTGEVRLGFYRGECWPPRSCLSDRVVDDSIAVCWRDSRQ